ncbi:hypothetical protein YC2023_099484 [Brassica napus]
MVQSRDNLIVWSTTVAEPECFRTGVDRKDTSDQDRPKQHEKHKTSTDHTSKQTTNYKPRQQQRQDTNKTDQKLRLTSELREDEIDKRYP